MNPEDKIKQFTATIERDARDESEKILSEVREELENATLAAEDGVLNETFRYIKNQVAAERTQTGRRVSRHMMDRKNTLNMRREEMATQVMTEVRGRLAEYVKTEAYFERILAATRDIMTAFGHQEAVLFLRKADMGLSKRLIDVLEHDGEHLTVREGTFELGGIMAVCPVTHMQIDESFDTKFEELRGHFAELFGLRLSR